MGEVAGFSPWSPVKLSVSPMPAGLSPSTLSVFCFLLFSQALLCRCGGVSPLCRWDLPMMGGVNAGLAQACHFALEAVKWSVSRVGHSCETAWAARAGSF